MECVRCGSTDFQEEDGFFFCLYCQTQSQGFAKEVAVEEEFYVSREVKVDSSASEEKSKKKIKTREGYSKWNSVEAFNEIYLGMIEDFFKIVRSLNCVIDETLFLNISMKIWFKYLRESEIAFLPDEHIYKQSKLHPGSCHRDNFLLGTASSASVDHLPLYRHIFPHRHRQQSGLQKFGRSYSVRSENRIESNKSYFDTYSNKYRDPRDYSKVNISPYQKPASLDSVRKILKTKLNKRQNQDLFLKYIENMITNSGERCLIEKDEPFDSNVNEKISDQFFDSSNYDSILLQRMPSKTKNLHEIVSLNKLKNTATSSPLFNDLISKRKLLALLYISIRLINLNIYLSDLIRWCVQGSIRYLNSLNYLPEFWEITWLDQNHFKNDLFPNYKHTVTVAQHLILHCCLQKDSFPQTIEIEHLVKRYIKDLNLPKGLFLVVMKKYGSFLGSYRQISDKVDDNFFNEFDIVAFIVVMLSLRDLFDMAGSSEKNYAEFKDNSQYENLFIWSDWLEYSKLRLNAIKSYFLNLPLNYDNLKNIDEILTKSQTENEYFRGKMDIKKITDFAKTRSIEYRFELQQSFEQLFFDERNFAWQNKISQSTNSLLSPSLFPLTQYTELILPKITNSCIKSKLKSNFRNKLITPYMNLDGFTYHRPISHFSDHTDFKNFNSTFFDKYSGDSFQHLFELGSIITCADLKPNYINLFVEAERCLIKQVDN